MSEELVNIFKNESFGDVRIITIENEPYFVGRDVAKCLGFQEPQKAVSRYCEDGHKVPILDSRGISQQTVVIPESDFYLLVFKSKRKKAKEFRSWVTKEVLPSIRKTGKYGSEEQIKVPTTLPEALKLAYEQAVLIEEQQATLTEQAPKVEFYDDVTGSNDTVDMGKVAKVLNMGIGRNKLFEFLRDYKILQSKNEPYQKYVDLGYFRIVESKYNKPDGSSHISLKTVVYQKGMDFIRKLLKKEL